MGGDGKCRGKRIHKCGGTLGFLTVERQARLHKIGDLTDVFAPPCSGLTREGVREDPLTFVAHAVDSHRQDYHRPEVCGLRARRRKAGDDFIGVCAPSSYRLNPDRLWNGAIRDIEARKIIHRPSSLLRVKP